MLKEYKPNLLPFVRHTELRTEDYTRYNTGDLLLAKRNSPCVPSCIQKSSINSFTNIGIIVRNPKFASKPGIYVMEYVRPINALDNSIMLIELGDIFNYWDGIVYYRRLSTIQHDNFDRELEYVYSKLNQVEFTTNFVVNDLSMGYGFKKSIKNKKALFVAYLYAKWGIINMGMYLFDLKPNDFSNDAKLVFRSGYFSDLIEVSPYFILNGW